MPRIEDYPDTFEEDLSGGPMATDMGESAKRGKYDRGGDLRQLPMDQFDPSGRGTIYHPQNNPSGTLLPYEFNDSGRRIYPGGVYPGDRIEQMQQDYATAAPSPASPDEVYGAYAPQPAQPGMWSNVMGGAMGNAMGRPGMANALLGGALGSAIKKNPGLLKRAAGGLMGAMTLGQLNRRKGY